MGIEFIIDSWCRECKEPVELDVTEIEFGVLEQLYKQAKRYGGIKSAYLIHFPPGIEDSTRIFRDLMDKRLIRRKSSRDADIYLINRQAFCLFESDFKVYSGIMKSLYYGNVVKGIPEVYVEFISKGTSIFDPTMVLRYAGELKIWDLLDMISKNPKGKSGPYNLKITELGKEAVNYLNKI